ncbi:MAG: HD-GYP domain-containing protein [Betaproteobacteria bacterium]|nr:HD-GYP domain-containing protein [Betaproteobacteria bacterium]
MKKIPVSDLRLGMYVQEICGSWMDHPFWKNSFKLDSLDDLHTLKSSVREVWIDTRKGLDVAADATVLTMEEAATQAQEVLEASEAANETAILIPLHEEVALAEILKGRAKTAVMSMFSDVRMGHALHADMAYPIVEEIHQSISRNTDALVSLVRLKNKDDYTYLHSVAVCALMIALGKRLGLDGETLRHVGMAGLLHDVGKMLVPEHILNKPGRLTDEEFEIVKSHPKLGHEVLLRSHGLSEATLDVCLHHHERMDGGGYPDRLAGENLSLYARMGAVCDVYDAITSERCYKKGWEPATAIHKMAEWQRGHFDLRIFHAFVKTVGIYPVGTLVRLKSGRLGYVVEQGKQSLTAPVVKVIFSEQANAHILPELVDLSEAQDAVLSSEDPQQWGLAPLF